LLATWKAETPAGFPTGLGLFTRSGRKAKTGRRSLPLSGENWLSFLKVTVSSHRLDPDKRYEVLGFQYHAVRTSGKVAPLAHGQFYALGAYHRESGEFLRTDRAVFVEGTTLQITEKLVGGGLFTYFVADLTGTIQSPNDLVYYPAAIIQFGANPPTIAAGESTNLFWNVAGASSISIDQGVGPQTGTYVLVKPEATTT
jgi:hypothetical protein